MYKICGLTNLTESKKRTWTTSLKKTQSPSKKTRWTDENEGYEELADGQEIGFMPATRVKYLLGRYPRTRWIS
jgi:hypothetical protein